jgi:hypothetical protein
MEAERIQEDLAAAVAAVLVDPDPMVAQTSEAMVGLGDPAIFLEWSRITRAAAVVAAIATRQEQVE